MPVQPDMIQKFIDNVRNSPVVYRRDKTDVLVFADFIMQFIAFHGLPYGNKSVTVHFGDLFGSVFGISCRRKVKNHGMRPPAAHYSFVALRQTRRDVPRRVIAWSRHCGLRRHG